MKKQGTILSIFAATLLCASAANAQEGAVSLQKASVETEVYEESGIGSQSVVGAKEIEVISSAELLNPYKTISLEAGVDIRTNDPFGMDISHKIRGKSDRNIGETLEGLPLKGIGPGGGLATMMDIENVSSVSVEKGAIKADSGFGYGSDNGMVDMKIQKPSKEFSSEIKQALGSYEFSKTYLRVDSGEVGDVAKFFVSGSLTKADKFKGEGESPNRKNFALGVASTSDQEVEWEVYGIYNDEKKHNYKGLTYEQSKDLSRYKDYDFESNLIAGKESLYYDRNKQDFQTYTIIAKLKVPVSDKDSLTFRPYFLNDKGYSYSGSGSNVIDWLVDHDTYGGVLEYAHEFDDAKVKAGYWYQEDEPPGPPTSRKIRNAATMDFVKWERIVKVDEKHKFNAPFLTYEQTFDNTIVEAGLKYLWMSAPKLTSYNTAGIGDVSYETALSQVSAVDFTLPLNTYEIFLPNIGVTHYLSNSSYIKASYGRNYNPPEYSFGGGMISYFNSPTVNKNEALIQKMWADLKPEESDNIDLSYIYEGQNLSLGSTLFYSKVKNVGGSFYDPILDYNYYQNNAKAESYGVELSAGYQALSNLLFKGALTYNHYAFTTDIESSAGSYIQTKGNQLPDVPLFFGNISAEYDLEGYKFVPIFRYLGKRYVDVEHNYDVDAHYLVDLSISKDFKVEQHTFALSLACTNVLDEEYISTFGASEINVKPDITYTVGAPRAVFASLSYKY